MIERAIELLNRVDSHAIKVGLEINTDKTEYMSFNLPSFSISLQGREIKKVSNFKYLGAMVASAEEDISHRISLAWTAYWQLGKIWRSKHTPTALKINIFRAAVVTILLYGCETWVLTSELERQLNSFATRCYRGILGLSLFDHISNDQLYQRVNQPPLIEVVRRLQLRWLGHALRRDDLEPAKIFALYEPEEGHGKSKVGRPRLTWSQYVSGILSRYRVGLTKDNIVELARDRKCWQKVVAVCSRATE